MAGLIGDRGTRVHRREGASPAAEIDPLPSARLLAWYDRHARDLPWRIAPSESRSGRRQDPYRVWLSEIMLQQTTVAAVRSYYTDFTRRWPSIEALAGAADDGVMSAWAGLGYYARARNLLACARTVVADHGGRFPTDAAGLRALPGIGDYTSAAIAAIAFGEAVPVVDGNVERVTTRLHGIDAPLPRAKAAIRGAVAAMVPADRPGDFAQAMMDLGATVCAPRRPACILCPIAEPCVARIEGRQTELPVKTAKTAKPLRVGAAFVAIRRRDGAVLLRRRRASGMLGGMAEPPGTGWSARQDGATGLAAAPFAADWQDVGEVRHGFTHFDLRLQVWRADVDDAEPADGWWAPRETLDGEALPTLFRKALGLALAS